MKTVRVQIKNVYGNDVYYPACPTAQLFADVAGTKTLTFEKLRLIKRAGYEVIVQNTAYAFAA